MSATSPRPSSVANSPDPADSRIPCWLDCDPGHDDCFAILLAGELLAVTSSELLDGALLQAAQSTAQLLYIVGLAQIVQCLAGHHPKLRLLGISTVAGNQTVEKTTANAVSMAAAAGLEVGERWVVPCMAPTMSAACSTGSARPAFDMQPGRQDLCLWLSRIWTAASSRAWPHNHCMNNHCMKWPRTCAGVFKGQGKPLMRKVRHIASNSVFHMCFESHTSMQDAL